MMKLFERFHELAKTIAPELPRVHLFDETELAGILPPVAGSLAWCAAANFDIRRMLTDRGRWRPAPIIVLRIAEIKKYAAECGRGDEWESFAMQIFIHELAHALPNTGHSDFEPTPTEVTAHRAAFGKWAASPTQPVPWYQHGQKFIRVCLHLDHRATAAGYEFPFNGIAGGCNYELSSIYRYARALGDEPERCVNETFAAIESTPAPDAFRELFLEDTKIWYDQNPEGIQQCLKQHH